MHSPRLHIILAYVGYTKESILIWTESYIQIAPFLLLMHLCSLLELRA